MRNATSTYYNIFGFLSSCSTKKEKIYNDPLHTFYNG